jgi:hypothetical protein
MARTSVTSFTFQRICVGQAPGTRVVRRFCLDLARVHCRSPHETPSPACAVSCLLVPLLADRPDGRLRDELSPRPRVYAPPARTI